MNQSNPNNEPTMDEILASIRKIISEDQPEVEAPNAPRSAAPEPPAGQRPEKPSTADLSKPAGAIDDELAGGDPLSDGNKLARLDPLPDEDELAGVDTLSEGLGADDLGSDDLGAEDLRSGDLDSIDFGSPDIEESDESLQEDYREEEPFGGDFISPSARVALDRAFAQIDAEPEPEPEPELRAPKSDATIEAVFARAVQDAFDPTLQDWVDNHGEEIVSRLAPLIREWMDENLPSLIEAAVTKEISRAARARRR